MTATKPRHLHPVPNQATAAGVESMQRAAQVLADRHAEISYQEQHARAAAAEPVNARERAALIAKLAYRLGKPGADVKALLEEFGTVMFKIGYMDGASEERPAMAGATLAAVIQIERVEQKLRDEASHRETERKLTAVKS